MRGALRLLRWLLWGVGGLVALVVVLIAVVFIGANTGPGRHLIETEISGITGRTVVVTGLAGRFPDRLRIADVTLADTKGPYARLDGLALDWHPLSLLGGLIDVDRLAAARIDVLRLPVPGPAEPKRSPPAKKGGVSLPLGLRLGALDLASIAIEPPVIGHAATVSATGAARIASLAPILAGFSLDNLPRGTVRIALRDGAGTGSYALAGDLHPGTINLTVDADEARGGLVAALARSEQISPLALHLALQGPTDAERLALTLGAGPLRLGGHGTVDLRGRSAAVDLAARAPAMAPVAGVSWQSVALDAHVHGPFTAPALAGTLAVDQLAGGGATIGSIRADLAGDRGRAAVRAAIAGLRIPGPKPDLLAAAPVTIDADARLDQPDRPVTFRVTHPLLTVAGNARTAGPLAAHATLDIPALAPFAAAGGVALDGHAALTLDAATAPDGALAGTVAGRLGITGGLSPVPALVGPDATLLIRAGKRGDALTLDRLAFDGRAVALDASGSRTGAVLDARAHLVLKALAALSPQLNGALSADLTARGPQNDLAATVHATGTVGAHGVPTGPISLDASATHLPSAPDATVALGGRLDGAPVTLRAHAIRAADGQTAVELTALDWKSLSGHARLALAPGATLPTGTADLRFARLADLSRLARQSLAGALALKLDSGADTARIDLRATGLAAAGAHVGTLALAGTVRQPTRAPVLDLRLAVAGAGTAAIGGVTANATARGPLGALANTLDATVPDFRGAPARLALADRLDLPHHLVVLDRLGADWHGERLALASPARITFAPNVSVQRLRVSLTPPSGAPALVAVDGTVSPRLALSADVTDLTPALATPFAPTLHAAGRIDVHARVAGTPARPTGTVTVAANGLRLLTGPAASLSPASLRARADLRGDRAALDASLDAGPRVALRVDGTAPISAGAPLALRTDGRIDLAVANPILEQGGRHVSGTVAIDASASGTLAHPSLAGTVRLANGDVQDYAQGAHLSAMDALLALGGDTLRIERFDARAGEGTIAASGTVGVLAPGTPVDVRLTMHDAAPISSDLLTARLDADIRATGAVASGLRVAGGLTVERADINVPNGLPPTVATLHVVRPGEQPPAPAGKQAAPIALDLALDAPGQIFVRGHGLDAVLGGHLHVGGTSTAPVISGGFALRRGTFSLAGVNLTFTRGTVGFNGTTNGTIDPTIDFLAESTVNQYTADLEVSGYASAPKIRLYSTPSLPQDQVLALILFGTETSNLSPFQIAQIAAALASLSGGGGGFDPLASVRNTLGLDRLSVGSGSGNGNNTGASVEGGKYVTRNVYVGARESTAGGGTQAVVQIDLTKRLKAFTTVGTGGTVTGATTPENDPGSSVGLKYQFRY